MEQNASRMAKARSEMNNTQKQAMDKDKNSIRDKKRSRDLISFSESSDEEHSSAKPVVHHTCLETSQSALFAIYNALQRLIVGPVLFNKLIADATSEGIVLADMHVVKAILLDHHCTINAIPVNIWKHQPDIAKGVYMARNVLTHSWLAIRRANNTELALNLDAMIPTPTHIQSFSDVLSGHHELFQLVRTKPTPSTAKRACTMTEQLERKMTATTSSMSLASLLDDESDADQESDGNEHITENAEVDFNAEFHDKISKMKLQHCTWCSELVPSEKAISDDISKAFKCNSCVQVATQGRCFWTTQAGDPRAMPKELALIPLSFVEEQLISLVCVNQYIYHRRSGTIAGKGHCIHFMQNIDHIASVLPRLPENVPIVIIQKKDWAGETTKDLRVRRHVVKTWLEWLKKNSILREYQRLDIDYDRIEALPEDGMLEGIEIRLTDKDHDQVSAQDRNGDTEEREDTDDGNPAFDSAVPLPSDDYFGEEEALTNAVNQIIAGSLKLATFHTFIILYFFIYPSIFTFRRRFIRARNNSNSSNQATGPAIPDHIRGTTQRVQNTLVGSNGLPWVVSIRLWRSARNLREQQRQVFHLQTTPPNQICRGNESQRQVELRQPFCRTSALHSLGSQHLLQTSNHLAKQHLLAAEPWRCQQDD